MGHRPAYPQVLEGVAALDIAAQQLVARLIEGEVLGAQVTGGGDAELGVGLEPLHILKRRVQHQIDLARGQRCQPGGIALDAEKSDRLDLTVARVSRAPPAVETLQLHPHVGLVLDQLERPGAVGIAHRKGLLLAVVVLRPLHPVLHAPGLVHDRHVEQLVGQHRVGRVELEIHRQPIDLADCGDALEREAALRGGAHRPLDREQHIVGGEHRAIVKLDPRPQLEAPAGGAGVLPTQRQRRLDLEGLVSVDQRVVDLVGDTGVVQQGHCMGVEGLGVESAGDAQRRSGGVGCRGQGRVQKANLQQHDLRQACQQPGCAGFQGRWHRGSR